MKLAFINPPGPRYLFRGSICTFLSKARYVWKPKDFILLSSIVPPQHEVVFLDAALNRIDGAHTLKWAKEQSPFGFVVALSSITWEKDLNFLRELRKQFPNEKIFVFGEVLLEPALRNTAEKFANGTIFDPLRFNFESCFLGDEPLSYPHRVGNSPKKNQERETFIPRHFLFDNVRYRWPFVKHFRFASVYTQFGCPFACTYCSEAITNVTFRPAENVLEELRSLHQQGYREIHLGDASFGFPRENAKRLLEGMIQEKFNFSWSSYVHPSQVDLEMIQLMKKSGCHTLVMGIDSADIGLLKQYGRHVSKNQLEKFVQNCKAYSIEVCGDIVLGFPEDTKKSCLDTIGFALELEVDYLSVNIATPLMGSAIREKQKTGGFLLDTSTGFDTAGLSGISPSSQLSIEELLELKSQAIRRFYFRPSYFWKRFRRLKSMEEFSLQTNEGLGIVFNFTKQIRQRSLQ